MEDDENVEIIYKEALRTFFSWALAIGSYFFPSFLASESSLTSTWDWLVREQEEGGKEEQEEQDQKEQEERLNRNSRRRSSRRNKRSKSLI